MASRRSRGGGTMDWTGVWGTGGRRILTSAQSVIQEVPQPHQSIIGLKSKVPFMHPSLLRAMVMDEEALCNLLNTKCNLLFLTYQTWSTFLNFLHSSTNSCNTSFCWINSCWRCSVPLTETEEIEITRWVSLHTRYLTIFCSFFAWLKNGGKRKITWWCVPLQQNTNCFATPQQPLSSIEHRTAIGWQWQAK